MWEKYFQHFLKDYNKVLTLLLLISFYVIVEINTEIVVGPWKDFA